MNSIELPNELKEPKEWVSLLIPSHNTKTVYIKECLDSIKSQIGDFGMEIIWINDGSDFLNTRLLEAQLKRFEQTTRFCKVIYKNNEQNVGVCKSLHEGLLLCSNEIVIRMDSDDIMFPERIQRQIDYMKWNPNVPCCGTNLQFFSESGLGQKTNHPSKITWEQYKTLKSQWFMNHPTLCFRKSAVVNVGNYGADTDTAFEDFELELRLLKHYGVLHNIPEVLLYYRIHEGQVTFNGKTNTPYWQERRTKFMNDMINSYEPMPIPDVNDLMF